MRSWVLRCLGQPDWPAAAHDMYELAWAEAGELTYAIGSRRYTVAAGAALVVPRGVEHKTRVVGDTRAGSVWLGQDMVSQVGDALGLGPSLKLEPGLVVNPQRVASLGRMLVETAADTGPGQNLIADSLAEALTVELVRGRAAKQRTTGPVDPRIARAVAQVEAAFAGPLSVDDLAHIAGMSRYHFSRLFKEQVGQSPYQFITRHRIARAARLLRRGNHSVTEAAMSVGMTELGRFSQVFRRQIGCTPSSYYRSNR